MLFTKKGIYLFLIVMLACSVSALDFNADLVAVNNKITIDDVAEYKLTIYNQELTEHTFTVKNKDYPSWDIRTKPIMNPILVTIPANSSRSINLFIDPNSNYVADSGSHFVNMNVVAKSTSESIPKQARIGIVAGTDTGTGYVPTVIVSSDFSEKINPIDELDFKITLANQNKLDIKNAKLVLSSNLINEEVKLDIGPKEEKVIEIKKQLDPKTKPQKDALFITLMYKDKKVDELVRNFEIIPYVTITGTTELKKGFLTSTETITFTNKGNVRFIGDLLVETTGIKKFFGSTDPDAESVKEDGKLNYKWEVSLEPFESYPVKVRVNYLGLLLLVVAIILAVVLFFLNRSPVVVTKKVTETETDEGGLSKLKVLINIKNRSMKLLKDIAVVDKIPKLLDIEKHTTLGSLKPSRVKKTSANEALILWDIDELQPGEERVINYYLKSNLKILGGLTLHPAMAKLKANDKDIKTRSNRVFVRV
jgi:hypothetical protein